MYNRVGRGRGVRQSGHGIHASSYPPCFPMYPLLGSKQSGPNCVCLLATSTELCLAISYRFSHFLKCFAL